MAIVDRQFTIVSRSVQNGSSPNGPAHMPGGMDVYRARAVAGFQIQGRVLPMISTPHGEVVSSSDGYVRLLDFLDAEPTSVDEPLEDPWSG